jgi:hypothetical protein
MTGYTTPVFTKALQFSQFLSTVPVVNNPAAPYIIYWHEASGTMQVGAWGLVVANGAVNMSNMLYFKFGGVVGFTNVVVPGTAWPGASAVKFNPVTGSPSYADFTTIPYWNGTNTTDGYISSNIYHTVANVKAGRGDPCKLVGLTVAQVQAGTIDNGKYRLPTHAELVAAYSSPTFVAGNGWTDGTTPTAGIHTGVIGTSFLPAAGERAPGGQTQQVGFHGHWWSSREYDGVHGYHLNFNSGGVNTYTTDAKYGFAVRCVPQS